jgi:ATP-binding cassette subfamily D (ALD) long-chain fatty acid import protein
VGVQAGEKMKPDHAVASRTESTLLYYLVLHRRCLIRSRTSAYISNRRLLLSLADAGGRIMYAYKDLLELAGLTTRLYTLLSTLHNVPPLPSSTSDTKGAVELSHVDVGIPHVSMDAQVSADGIDLDERGTPTLVRDLSFVVKEGEHLMITGSNGVGKTAIARVLAGLWAAQGYGALVKHPAHDPSRKNVFVVPQRAYMVTGSLLDQMIYPHSYAEFLETGKTEEDLMNILEMVHLRYLPEREGGWLTRKEWRDVLSGGEKQRVRTSWFLPAFSDLS